MAKNNIEWRLKNPERWKAFQKKYRDKTKKQRNAKARKRYHANKGKVLSRSEIIERAILARNKQAKERAKTIMESGRKKCSHCGIIKPLDEYYPDPRNAYTMLQSACKECQLTNMKKSNKRKREKILNQYGGKCVLCQIKIEEGMKYALHHISYNPEKKVLLCHKCHNTLHCLRIYKLDFVKKHGSDLAPYEWAKKVIALYEEG